MREEIICEGVSRGVAYRLIRFPSGRMELQANYEPTHNADFWEEIWSE